MGRKTFTSVPSTRRESLQGGGSEGGKKSVSGRGDGKVREGGEAGREGGREGGRR